MIYKPLVVDRKYNTSSHPSTTTGFQHWGVEKYLLHLLLVLCPSPENLKVLYKTLKIFTRLEIFVDSVFYSFYFSFIPLFHPVFRLRACSIVGRWGARGQKERSAIDLIQ